MRDADGTNCPSAEAGLVGGAVIGVAGRLDGVSRVSMLPQPVPFEAVAALIPDTVPATEVLRFTAPCAEGKCRHFDGRACTLAARVVASLPEVADRLPRCAIRPSCRWWRQEGAAACRRCPQIVTEPFQPDATQRALATPAAIAATQPASTDGE